MRTRRYDELLGHEYFAAVDCFNCFNSFSRDDVSSYVGSQMGDEARNDFSRFLRTHSTGSPTGCFPQGHYPTKALGNEFLCFVEEFGGLRSSVVLRFLDDIFLFDQSLSVLEGDVLTIQQVLSEKGIYLNDAKTRLGERWRFGSNRTVTSIKERLLQKREELYDEYDEDEEDEDDEPIELSDEEKDFLVSMLSQADVDQSDVELASVLLRDEPDAVALLHGVVVDEAPHLLRGLYRIVERSSDDDVSIVYDTIAERLGQGTVVCEHDLFWYARILVDFVEPDQPMADLLIGVHDHPSSTPTVRAAVLESDGLEFGMADLKLRALRESGSVLESAAAMVGLAGLEKTKRNSALSYARAKSSHVAVLADIAKKFPADI